MNRESNAPIYTVTQLNQEIRYFLETNVAPLWITGELSNFVSAASGHWYFTLKDKNSALRCAFFQARTRTKYKMPQNGDQVIIHGKISLYEARGDYQFIVDYLEPAGDGLLQQAFNQLKEKLLKEGLFDTAHKKPLPKFPQTIGVITSPSGAVIHDVLHVLKKRFPLINIILYPTAVQGITAAKEIEDMIKLANKRNECDVLIVGRGGGSLEDLWPFNEEIVARAIFNSNLPIISAVGHEVDFTIADFVADVRAPTPSAAAAIVSPNIIEIEQTLLNYYQRLRSKHPQHIIEENAQKLDRLEQSLLRAFNQLLTEKKYLLNTLSTNLNAVSPLATLERGYAVLSHEKTGEWITHISQLKTNDLIKTRLHDGEFTSNIIQVMPHDNS